jgi:hypothetical protein
MKNSKNNTKTKGTMSVRSHPGANGYPGFSIQKKKCKGYREHRVI